MQTVLRQVCCTNVEGGVIMADPTSGRVFPSKLMRLLEKRQGKPEPISETLNVLGYEFGDLQKALTYMRFYPDYRVAYIGEAKAAMADLLAQAELICETMGWDLEDLRVLGDARFLNSDELDRRHSRK